MSRFSRKRLFQLSIAILFASIVFLLWISNKSYGLSLDLLLLIMLFQGKVAFVVSLVVGGIVAATQRSFRAGGMTLAGIFYGAMVSGTFGLAVGLSVSEVADRISPGPTDPDLPNLGAALVGFVVWVIIAGIGALWGGLYCFGLWHRSDRRQR